MKKIFYYVTFLCSVAINGQSGNVGINNANPQTQFHIDGQKDNPKSQTIPSTTQLNNDFAIDKNGFVGIGVLPDNTARVNIHTDNSINTEIGKGFRLKDGTEGNGNLLSLLNTNGDVIWKKRIATVPPTWQPTSFPIPVNSDLQFTGTTITLPPGKWLIRSSLLLRVEDSSTGIPIDGSFADGSFARLSWGDKNADGTYAPTTDAINGNVFGGAYFSRYGLAFGQTLVNNTTTAPKVYYLITRMPTYWGTSIITGRWRGLGQGVWGENSILAFAAN